jgi:hypothetical protein
MSIPKSPVKIKLTGDTHLPDVESDLDIEEATSSLAKLAQPRDQGGRPLVRHAGILVAPETDTDVDATAGARDASTSRRTLSRGGDAGRDAPGEDAGRGSARPQRLGPGTGTGPTMGMDVGTGGAGARQPQMTTRSATGVWIGALAAAVLLVRLLR